MAVRFLMRHVSQAISLPTIVLATISLLFAGPVHGQARNELRKAGPNAPTVKVLRDDRVATLEMDYIQGNPWTPFEINADGLGPVGFRVRWKRANTKTLEFEEKVTSFRRIQIQPLLNNVPYYVRVDYLNRFGELTGDRAYGIVRGGKPARVTQLRADMTGFFDDFNSPAGLPDERKWNTTFSKVNDPALQAFFINSQFHSHTLVGTRAYGFGDRGQTTHRIRNPLNLGAGETRRIVFDLDGVNVGGRSIWYLDLLKEESEITSHFTLGGGEGFSGHPSPGLRFSLAGQNLELFTINQKGEQLLLARNNLLDFSGVQTFPNVRRSFELLISENHVDVLIDNINVLETDLGSDSLSPGDYTVHWTAFGYNTMKVNMPYYLLHWDNFGFDGPAPDHVVHNYRTQVMGTDYVQSDDYQPATVSINIPDDLTPTTPGVTAEARLVFTRQMADWQYPAWSAVDTVIVGGQEFPIEFPSSSSNPPMELEDLISTNAAYSTYVPLGTIGQGGTAPLIQGQNEITFETIGCGFHNIHIEVKYTRGTEPEYTPPQDLHPIPLHHHMPKIGLLARITNIGQQEVDSNVYDMNLIENFHTTVSGTIGVGAIVNGERFNSNTSLRSDFISPTIAGTGENPGVSHVELWIRPDNGDESTAVLLESIDTDADYPAPQFINQFTVDTTQFANGIYELYFVAEDSRGVRSIPDFGGVGRQAATPEAISGFYFPLHMTIAN